MKWFFALSLLCALLLACGEARADRRSYVWTYEYMTMPQDMMELEYYTTVIVPEQNESNVNTWKHWAELEYGITDHWDVALYQQFKQANGAGSSEFEYDGFKVRTRYRIGEKNRYPVDPLLYLEYKRDDDLSAPHVLEAKIILAKDIDVFNVAYNQVIEQELEKGGETEHAYALAASYALHRRIKVGLESKGNYTEETYYLGPTISFLGGKFWAASGVVFGLNDHSDDVQARLIIGIPF
jgi:hypothetical protein